MFKFSINTWSQCRGFVSEFVTLFRCQSLLLILKSLLHLFYFFKWLTYVDILSHWLPSALRLVWCSRIVMSHGILYGCVIDWLLIYGRCSLAIFLLILLIYALLLACRLNHILWATELVTHVRSEVAICGSWCNHLSTVPFLQQTWQWFNITDCVLRWLWRQLHLRGSLHQIDIDINRGCCHIERNI